jgi:hypothetical protein
MRYIVPISVGGVRSQKPNAPNFGGGWSAKISGRTFLQRILQETKNTVALRALSRRPRPLILFLPDTLTATHLIRSNAALSLPGYNLLFLVDRGILPVTGSLVSSC